MGIEHERVLPKANLENIQLDAHDFSTYVNHQKGIVSKRTILLKRSSQQLNFNLSPKSLKSLAYFIDICMCKAI